MVGQCGHVRICAIFHNLFYWGSADFAVEKVVVVLSLVAKKSNTGPKLDKWWFVHHKRLINKPHP